MALIETPFHVLDYRLRLHTASHTDTETED